MFQIILVFILNNSVIKVQSPTCSRCDAAAAYSMTVKPFVVSLAYRFEVFLLNDDIHHLADCGIPIQLGISVYLRDYDLMDGQARECLMEFRERNDVLLYYLLYIAFFYCNNN